ncbi:hypothetical protein Ddc_11384 [Ditylenchus destructor]|nr:hypothetical protein Ddc_11384 [Ditylenchus destructor]
MLSNSTRIVLSILGITLLLSICILEYERRIKNPIGKPNTHVNAGKHEPGCTGAECRKPNYGSKQCGTIRCSNSRYCKESTRGACPYCASGYCSKQKTQHKHNDEAKSKSETKSQGNARNLPRFTRVSRRYPWHTGRTPEMRIPGLKHCILKTCRNDKQCARPQGKGNSRKRLRRGATLSCFKCQSRKCVNQRQADRWKDQIKEDQITRRLYLTGLDRAGNFCYTGQLRYSGLMNETGEPYMILENVRTHDDHTRKHIATALVEKFIEEKVIMAHQNRVRMVKLEVLNGRNNTSKAWKLYQKVGFDWNDPSDPENIGMTLQIENYHPAPEMLKEFGIF